MKKWKRGEWRTVSREFCSRHKLPKGSRVVLIHTKKGGRQARNDRVMRYRRFRSADRAPGSCTISRLFKEYLEPALSIDLSKHGLKPKLYGPNGETPGGGTILKTVRRLPPLPSVSEIEARERRESEIEQIRETAFMSLVEDEFDWEPQLVCTGHLMALVDYYGKTTVEDELAKISEVY